VLSEVARFWESRHISLRKWRDTIGGMANRATITELLGAILAAVGVGPDGSDIDEIAARLSTVLPRRTLQRHLATLVKDGKLTRFGNARATRYRLPDPPASEPAAAPNGPASTPAGIEPAPEAIALTALAREVFNLVSKPVTRRKPVGYARAFLDSYKPNVTRYLSDADRARMAQASRTAAPDGAPAGTYSQMTLQRLLIDLSWNSSRLEGNTYSLLDTQRLLEAGAEAEGRDRAEAQMILNHKQAIEFLVQGAEDIAFDRRTVLNLHALLSEALLPDAAAEGRLRRRPVSISQSVFHPLEGPQRIEECFDVLLDTAQAIEDPFEQAFFVMVQLPYLQPFEDVNKRVSRLAANIPFIRRNLTPLAFVDVPADQYVRGLLGVYELNRIELLRDVFVWGYERSALRYASIRQSQGEPDSFRQRFRRELKQIVADVMRDALDQAAASKRIAAFAASAVEAPWRAKLIEVAETELLNMHSGNFARYGVRPSEFDRWSAVWSRLGRDQAARA
jgi:hypothetical protein